MVSAQRLCFRDRAPFIRGTWSLSRDNLKFDIGFDLDHTLIGNEVILDWKLGDYFIQKLSDSGLTEFFLTGYGLLDP
jgi:hypothetical protein